MIRWEKAENKIRKIQLEMELEIQLRTAAMEININQENLIFVIHTFM